MASLSTSVDGLRRIRFKGLDGREKTVRLGRLEKRQCEVVRNYVGRLEAAQKTGNAIDADTLAWLGRITAELHSKLAHVGLVAERQTATLGSFLAAYIDGRANLKPNTLRNYRVTEQHLLKYFGPNKLLGEITPGDADDWRESLLRGGMGKATLAREVKRAKQYFEAAERRKLIPESPFAHLKGGKQENRSRFYFVSAEEAKQILDACPDAEWRAIFALARFGGLRCPSEIGKLRWNDILWDQDRFRVRSPKTEHREGKGARMVPLFPELRPYLDEAYAQAEEGAVYVAPRCRDPQVNLRTELERIAVRAGVEPWPKLFQNLRSTRETELAEEFPIHVVCGWIGNSELVAAKHYLQVTEEHFQRASGQPEEATQNPTRPALVQAGRGSSKKSERPVITENYEPLPLCAIEEIPPRGVEPRLPD